MLHIYDIYSLCAYLIETIDCFIDSRLPISLIRIPNLGNAFVFYLVFFVEAIVIMYLYRMYLLFA